MTDKNASLQDKLRALEEVFLQKLPGKIEEITSTTRALLEQPANKELLTVLHRLLHTMAGSAGTFGFDAIGAQARVFEGKLKPLMNGGVWSQSEWQAYANELLDYFSNAMKYDGQPVKDEMTLNLADEVLSNEKMLIYLVGENQQQNREIINQLTHFGYEVLQINDISQLALQVVTRRPSVIVAKLLASEDSDHHLAQIAKAKKLVPFDLPVVFISQTNSFEARIQAVRAQGEGFFTEPIDLVALTERIEFIAKRSEGSSYRILIIDDDAVTARFYATILRDAGMTVHVSSRPELILNVMADFRPELLLVDVYMPDCSGIELAKLIRQDNSFVDVPIIFFSSEAGPERQLEAVRAGADDFITKPVSSQYLLSSLSNRVERYRSLRSLIMRDGLTGLLNHTALKEQLAAEVAQAGRSGAPLALAMIDLDRFKSVNDTYGHPVGDQVLKTLSRLLRQRLRRGDIVGRYGGEEFAVIFPDTNAETARKVLDQVRLAFVKIEQHANQQIFTATFSAGVADLELAADVEEIIEAADNAMYVAKQKGRNCIELA